MGAPLTDEELTQALRRETERLRAFADAIAETNRRFRDVLEEYGFRGPVTLEALKRVWVINGGAGKAFWKALPQDWFARVKPYPFADIKVAIALGKLTALQREAVKHVYFCGLTEDQAAKQMGRNRNDVHGYLNLARKRLRILLSGSEELQGEPWWGAHAAARRLEQSADNWQSIAGLVESKEPQEATSERQSVERITTEQWHVYEKAIRSEVERFFKQGAPKGITKAELCQRCRFIAVKAVAEGSTDKAIIRMRVRSRLIDLRRQRISRNHFENQIPEGYERFEGTIASGVRRTKPKPQAD